MALPSLSFRSLSVLALVASLGFKILPKSQSPRVGEPSPLSDFSSPPPWPVLIVIVLNALAGAFQSAADALTPPPVRCLELSMGYRNTMLGYIASRHENTMLGSLGYIAFGAA